MPNHSNTLVFGTTTKVAIDVAQEPTGALGVTIGYKRHEAVWMPLIANKEGNGKLMPNSCSTDACTKLVGTTGSTAVDTYSVLATFSGDMSGSGKSADAKGSVAQYFATGFAARSLAERGGAAVVNSAATEPVDPDVQRAAKEIIETKNAQIAAILDAVTKTDGSVDAAKVDPLLVSSRLPEHVNQRLKAPRTRLELDLQLRSTHQGYIQKLFSALS